MSQAALLADVILVVHAAIVVFVVAGLPLIVAGGLLGWRWTRNRVFRLAHLGTILFVAVQAWLGELCPLTIWEQQLRDLAGESRYDGSFIEHWLSRVLFFDAPGWVFVAAYTAFAVLVALSWRRWPPRAARSRRGTDTN